MINYVNNSFDKVLKPCDAQQFMTLTQSEQTERLILSHRAGEPKAKIKLPALTYMGVFDKKKYEAHLGTPSNSPSMGRTQTSRNNGTRKAEFMRPTGLLMIDFDHSSNPRAIYDALFSCLASAEVDPTSVLALAHITPSGDGLRLVLKREKGKSIQQGQYEWFKRIQEHYEGELTFDDVCKDISRLSFAPMQREILYYNPSLLFAPLPPQEDYPDGTLWGGVDTDPLRSATPCSAALPIGSSVAQSTVLPSLGTACHLGNPLKASLRPLKEGQCFSDSHFAGNSAMEQTKEHCPSETGGRAECSVNGTERRGYDVSAPFPTDYNGVEYEEIIKRLEEQLGGAPEHGARNSFIFTMACNLRYICNDDPQWIASVLPTYGEDPQKQQRTIQSAVQRPMSREMPETMKRALKIAKMCAGGEGSEGSASSHSPLGEKEGAFPPALPAVLPDVVDLLVSRTPEHLRPAVAMSVFPPLGAHVHGLEFAYWDGRDYEPTFMNVLVAELSAGKSAVNKPIAYIMADIEARDEVALNRESEWKDKCARVKSTEDKPERPKGLVIQSLSADMTNAAFVQRLSDAEDHFLYTDMDEIELLNALRTNTQGTVSAILRLAFDCGKYGQVRVATNAVNAKVRVRWNWNASSTVQRVRRFFAKNIADGTLSRISFSTIIKDEDDWGDRLRPQFLRYDERFAKELSVYIDRLLKARGLIECPEAKAWADQLSLELIGFAREIEDRTYAQFSHRAVLMGFFRAMLLYVMNDCQWTQTIADFARWSVEYDLWCKMRFFSDMIRSDLQGEKTSIQRGPVSLLTLLPKEFTREDVRALRIAQGMKPDPKEMISKWVTKGFVKKDEATKTYSKLK